MSSEILQSFLRGELRGDLVQAVRTQAQSTVLRRLIDQQTATDALALVSEAKAKLPALHQRLAELDELIAHGAAEVQAKRLEKAPHMAALEEARVKAERLNIVRAEESIMRIDREAAELSALLTTERNRRNTTAVQVERLTNALAQLQPLVGAAHV